MSNNYLHLWLEGPLQAWGCDSKFGRRETLPFPSRSGIMGLLLCSLGKKGEQSEFLEKFLKCSLMVLGFCRVGERDSSSLPLRDFHMVGNGYEESDPWQNLMIPKTSEGKKAVGGGAKLTYRYFLEDKAFSAILEIPEGLGENLENSLKNPEWELFLGRKCCIPTEFIFQGLYLTLEDALENSKLLSEKKGWSEIIRVVEGDEEEGEKLILNDLPLTFGLKKQYRQRRVSVLKSVG